MLMSEWPRPSLVYTEGRPGARTGFPSSRPGNTSACACVCHSARKSHVDGVPGGLAAIDATRLHQTRPWVDLVHDFERISGRDRDSIHAPLRLTGRAPRLSYDKGVKVCRVEQTQTPDPVKKRTLPDGVWTSEKIGGERSMRREVCSADHARHEILCTVPRHAAGEGGAVRLRARGPGPDASGCGVCRAGFYRDRKSASPDSPAGTFISSAQVSQRMTSSALRLRTLYWQLYAAQRDADAQRVPPRSPRGLSDARRAD